VGKKKIIKGPLLKKAIISAVKEGLFLLGPLPKGKATAFTRVRPSRRRGGLPSFQREEPLLLPLRSTFLLIRRGGGTYFDFVEAQEGVPYPSKKSPSLLKASVK